MNDFFKQFINVDLLIYINRSINLLFSNFLLSMINYTKTIVSNQ